MASQLTLSIVTPERELVRVQADEHVPARLHGLRPFRSLPKRHARDPGEVQLTQPVVGVGGRERRLELDRELLPVEVPGPVVDEARVRAQPRATHRAGQRQREAGQRRRRQHRQDHVLQRVAARGAEGRAGFLDLGINLLDHRLHRASA